VLTGCGYNASMLETAIEAAAAAGKLLRKNFGATLTVDEVTHHDIKLAIDKQAQQVITKVILADYPDHCILGEEGVTGNANADVRWVVDPLDGTVNYFYGIPHYAVSVAAQVRRASTSPTSSQAGTPVPPVVEWETVAGVVLAPEVDELFASEKGEPAVLHGRRIQVSDRADLSEAILAIGFFKSAETINRSLEDFKHLVGRVRKVRIMGAAALDVVYVACGRFDAYIEYGIKLWDIAAGQLILENAGGRAALKPHGDARSFDVRMWNGKLPLDELTTGAS